MIGQERLVWSAGMQQQPLSTFWWLFLLVPAAACELLWWALACKAATHQCQTLATTCASCALEKGKIVKRHWGERKCYAYELEKRWDLEKKGGYCLLLICLLRENRISSASNLSLYVTLLVMFSPWQHTRKQLHYRAEAQSQIHPRGLT